VDVDAVTANRDDEELLDETTAGPYLVARGVVAAGEVGSTRRLSGGVSSVVLRVTTSSGDLVIKQALGKLDVADDWYADRRRAQVESLAIATLGPVTPGRLPVLVDDDPDRCALVMTAAPLEWGMWKADLMAGVVDPSVAGLLGRVLRDWHRATMSMPAEPRFDDPANFDQLRVNPYFRVTADRCPALAGAIYRTADAMVSRRQCLVIGDFSPKNVLVGDSEQDLWVIDLEVAHRGDPGFDLAFMTSHLVLKSLHVQTHRAALWECIAEFMANYDDGPGSANQAHVVALVGCLLAARVNGTSPAEYLEPAEKAMVMAAAQRLLLGGPSSSEWWRDLGW
jgi:5-methylthioribose kinase